jgi:DNA-binding NarL/FixJ family response regulator
MRQITPSCIPTCAPPPLWMLASRSDSSNLPEGKDSAPATTARRLRILIVEDEILIAIDMRGLLEGSGHIVVGIADSADHAITTALRERPDVVLMDIALTGPRDGIDAALELRERLDIPSLFITAHSDLAMRHRAEAARPLGFLSKPLDDDMLRRILARL